MSTVFDKYSCPFHYPSNSFHPESPFQPLKSGNCVEHHRSPL